MNTRLEAPRSAAVLQLVAAVALVVAGSAAAYAGKVPPLFSAHGIDKVLHASMAATLTFLLARALRGRAWLAALLVLGPLAADEFLQRYSAVRTSDWADLAADVAGAVAAAAFAHGLRRRAALSRA